MKQAGLSLTFSKGKTRKTSQEARPKSKEEAPYYLKAKLTFNPNPKKGGVRMGLAQGRLALSLSLHKASSYFYPLGEIQGEDLYFPFLTPALPKSKRQRDTNLPDKQSMIYIKEIRLHKAKKADKIRLSALAYLLGARLELSGQKDLRFYPNAGEFLWESDWTLNSP